MRSPGRWQHLVLWLGTIALMVGVVDRPQAQTGEGAAAVSSESAASAVPLVRWNLLRQTIYRPPTTVIWADGILALEGQRVRLEGYLLPRFNNQDPEDLLLSALHPRSIFCGPTDMTALVEVNYFGFEPEEWPTLPVEVTGTLHISSRPGNLFWLYHLRADSWRPLRTWEQDFPGVVDEPRQAEGSR